MEYTTQGNKRTSAPVIVAAKETGSGMTVTGLATGTNFTFHVSAGQGVSYYEPHGTTFSVQTAGSVSKDVSGGLSSGQFFLFSFFLFSSLPWFLTTTILSFVRFNEGGVAGVVIGVLVLVGARWDSLVS